MASILHTIRHVQKVLGITVDGKAGPQTWAAIEQAICSPKSDKPLFSKPAPPQLYLRKVDERSERNIATLAPHVQQYARALVIEAQDRGITIKVISALRTYDEQNALYAKGRTLPGKKVTNARGGYSNHNFGIAFDVCIFDGKKPVWESPLYKVIGSIGRDLGLEWGGDWKSIVDQPHFQLRPKWAKKLSERKMLTVMRQKKDAGEVYNV